MIVFYDLFGCRFFSRTKEHSGLCDWGWVEKMRQRNIKDYATPTKMIVADNFDYLLNMNEGNVGATNIPFFFLLSRPFIVTFNDIFTLKKGVFPRKNSPQPNIPLIQVVRWNYCNSLIVKLTWQYIHLYHNTFLIK